MAEWQRVRLARRQVLVVEAGDIKVTIHGEGRVQVAPADSHLQPHWRQPPLARLTPVRNSDEEDGSGGET